MTLTDSLHNMYSKLKRNSSDRERLYASKSAVDWATYATNQREHQKKVVEVKQKDFAFGTLRITEPCLLRFTETVEFNPNAPRTWLDQQGEIYEGAWNGPDFIKAAAIDPSRNIDWFPNPMYQDGHLLPDGSTIPMWVNNKADYLTGDANNAYRFGFFAAITIEAPGVIIDLNGFTLRQHAMHALMQRFFALIELADQPFIHKQGPATEEGFGTRLVSAQCVTIKNGELGQSSHHAIHGNDCQDVLIEDVNFRGHEVAAISLNGAQRVAIVNCHSFGSRQPLENSEDPSSHGVPVLGTFSASRFVLAAAKHIYDPKDAKATWPSHDYEARNGFIAAMEALDQSVNQSFNEVIFEGRPTPSLPLFANPLGLPDGPAYGILCSPPGVAVGPFLESLPGTTEMEVSDYYLENVTVEALAVAPREILSISGGERNGNQVDNAGAVLQLFGLGEQPGCRAEDGTYAGTVLSDMQIRLAQAKRLFSGSDTRVKNAFNTLSIEDEIVAWALTDHDPDFINPYPDAVPPYKLHYQPRETGGYLDLQDDNGQPVGYSVKIRCNGDSMHHVHKGTVGFRLEGISRLSMNDCTAKGVTNQGPVGSDLCGHYQGGFDGGHEDQGTKLIGYTGSDAYGIRLSGCEDSTLNQCHVDSVVSTQGSGFGLHISNSSRDILLNGCEVHSVKAGTQVNLEEPWNGPNLIPKAFGLKTDSDTSGVAIEHCIVNSEEQPDFPKPSSPDSNRKLKVEIT